MDFSQIDSFMKETGLANEPAFDFLHFINEPIPQTMPNRTILGLYYSESDHDQYGYLPPSTIHLPPDATYSTLLHELGHRYGHYYYNDLSESFAEKYRKAHEGGGYMKQALDKSMICRGCPEMQGGRSRVCLFCDYGGGHTLERALPDKSQAGWRLLESRHIAAPHSQPVRAVSDYSVNWSIVDWTRTPMPGDLVSVYITGQVGDINGGLNDHWAIVVAVAAIDGSGNPTALKVYKTFPSSQYGVAYPYDNDIFIADNTLRVPPNWNAIIGPMPSSPINVVARLYANHSDGVPWTWALW